MDRNDGIFLAFPFSVHEGKSNFLPATLILLIYILYEGL